MLAGWDAVPAGVEDTATSPGGRRSKRRAGYYGPATSGARETRKRTDTAMARRKTRTHPSLMRQTRRFRVAWSDPPGRSGEIRNMRLSARHPPHWGREKEKEDGRTLAPS